MTWRCSICASQSRKDSERERSSWKSRSFRPFAAVTSSRKSLAPSRAYCRGGARPAFLLLAALALCFCGGPEGPKRIAVLRFENLSPDPATDWIGRAISQEVAGQLEGSRHQAIIPFAVIRRFDNTLGPRPVSAPGISTEQGAAIASGANRT